MGIFSSLFGGSKSPEQENEKKFDILKYDGIRAMRIGKLTYAIKCFEEATALREDLETMLHQANAYVRANRMDDARQLMERATHLEPRRASTYLALANLCYMAEDYAAMNKACQDALALDEYQYALMNLTNYQNCLLSRINLSIHMKDLLLTY